MLKFTCRVVKLQPLQLALLQVGLFSIETERMSYQNILLVFNGSLCKRSKSDASDVWQRYSDSQDQDLNIRSFIMLTKRVYIASLLLQLWSVQKKSSVIAFSDCPQLIDYNEGRRVLTIALFDLSVTSNFTVRV